MTAPRLACLDLDTFFVSVERLLDPRLVGQPVVVGGAKGGRGVVTSSSYEARAFGVRSGMSLAEASRLAPDAIYVPTRHDTYGDYAAKVKAILVERCPVVQTASIDEFYLDFSGCDRLFHQRGDASGDDTIRRTAWDVCGQIQREVGLPSSMGLGTTRAIAKIASGRAKPAGVLLVPAGGERAFVSPLPVRKFPGIGPVAEERLVRAGVTTLGALLASSAFPELSEHVQAGITPVPGYQLGVDRPAFREHDEPGTDGSLSNERTFFQSLSSRAQALEQLLALCERVTWRARRRGLRARTVTVKYRLTSFDTFTRSASGAPTDHEGDVYLVARRLLEANWAPRRALRLLGVGLSNFEAGPRQVPLFGAHRPAVGEAIDAVRARHGFDAIRLGITRRA